MPIVACMMRVLVWSAIPISLIMVGIIRLAPKPIPLSDPSPKTMIMCRLPVAWLSRPDYGSADMTGPIAPENSLAAFAAACEAGYGIELDVQLTLDGQVVVVHDADLLRVAGDPRRIEDLTYDELARIPLFPNGESGDLKAEPLPGADANPPLVVTPSAAPKGYYQHVPLFSDVLDVVAGRAPLIVEYKFSNNRAWDERSEELMEKGHALLEAYDGPYVIESFHPGAVNWYKEHHPEVCRGQLSWPAKLSKKWCG